MASSLRSEVVQLYKQLLYLGREYPKGAEYFRKRLHNAFWKNRDVSDPDEIRRLIKLVLDTWLVGDKKRGYSIAVT
ncbi:hypothetical protein CRM22_000280 [Opisthorchis felineus]|uniref:Complex 1 LYR protein domain-containing protein n=1 Tax=Opisthorchis felineus TaxID=147828 RepID=A0A4S2MMQ3_OPIFE|nr:hypothetical protein CRM22_000280 [Opisthorchis felineus]